MALSARSFFARLGVRRIVTSVFAAFFLLLGLGGWFAYENLPRLPGVPKAPVVGVPEGALDHLPQSAYLGDHPRKSGRPSEYFPFPIAIGESGPVETLFSGPSTYPFLCGQNKLTYLQPLVDNHDGEGIPIFSLDDEGQKTDEVIGYSRDCSHATSVSYFYRSTVDGLFHRLEKANNDIDKVTVNGRTTDFVVRLETGTINRFFYAIAVLRGEGETADKPNGSNWNKRLIYQFRGGVGVGRRQGNMGRSATVERREDQLARGYAIVYSTANQTSNHYNIWLAEDTARRLKKQFISLYGEPLYTVGVGGSGGAIQQYLIAQNAPDVLDAAIPLYSYPDMVSQTIYVFDCEPLEYYFDVVVAENSRWKNVAERESIIGLATKADFEHRFKILEDAVAIFDPRYRGVANGTSECVQGWRGLVPLVNNPNFIHFKASYADEVADKTHWTHWEDLRDFYGAGHDGYANSAWDNQGVQYGLEALKRGKLSIDEFLHLNATIGGWKAPLEQGGEKLWFMNGDLFPVDLSVWSEHNMNLGSLDNPAPRSVASMDAIEGIYRSGHVFLGDVEIPIVDLRHYLEGELDMHHSLASFSSRERIRRARGHADNQLIWMSHKKYDPIDEALDIIDHWIQKIAENPERGVAGNKPVEATDRCFDKDGNVLAAGSDVWDGAWNYKADGACMQLYPIYSTSRMMAGAPITGDVFKCALQPLERAIAKEVYGQATDEVVERIDDMRRIFPDGVCNYNLGDIARPGGPLFPQEGDVMIAGQSVESDYRLVPAQIAQDSEPEEEVAPTPVSVESQVLEE
ncbi:DUF6351 family protein [Microbulbifer agarilyticus]|uniref:DUF6351 family protein n=1 Tax=Microbulbifer agarilyticus TaxID=260552 RepID=UPI001CD64144|nr:DUF6351 family protein [Microbulbifer agarilyticus]MCA0893723.1 DUF6351 family protein [Microbulbifer agarilyticus]